MFRLLDVESSEGRFDNELIFYMVFEYMEQDLDHFISQCPAPGLDEVVVKVCVDVCICNLDQLRIGVRLLCDEGRDKIHEYNRKLPEQGNLKDIFCVSTVESIAGSCQLYFVQQQAATLLVGMQTFSCVCACVHGSVIHMACSAQHPALIFVVLVGCLCRTSWGRFFMGWTGCT